MTTYASVYGVGAVSAGEKYLAIRPKIPRAPAPLGVLYCHSSNGQAHEPQYFGGVMDVMAALAQAGHPILSCELGGLSPWGNVASQLRVSEAYTYLTAQMGARAGKVALVGLSMGGLTALAWAGNNRAKVAGVVGLIPALDMTAMVAAGSPGIQASINAAYGGTYTEAMFGPNHNPQTMAVAGKYEGIPIRTYYGDSDTTCLPATQVAFAKASGADARPLPGGHSSTTLAQISPAEVVSFVAGLAG